MQRIKGIFKKLGRKNSIRLMFLFGYLVAFGIPFTYAYLAELPTQDSLLVSEGTAHFQYRMKQGHMLMVEGHDYTCGGQYLNADPSCFSLTEGPAKRVLLEGKSIQVVWFHQSSPIFSKIRRVADIRYGGVSQLPPRYLENSLQYERASAKEDALITFFGMLLVLLFYEWMERIRIRNERRFG